MVRKFKDMMVEDIDDPQEPIIIEDPVDYAKRLGLLTYLKPGELTFTELEISYLMSCLKRRTYNDNPQIRARRHVLLDWENSWWKSSILNYFSWSCCGGRELTKAYRSYLTFHFINLCGDIKRPILRGSINRIGVKGGGERIKLVLPLMKYPDVWIADELLDFLGEFKSDMYNYMLSVLEGGRGKVSMVSMVGAKPSKADRTKLKSYSIEFDSDLGMMSYWTRGTFWGGTRPIEEDLFLKKLWTSGFLNRFVVVPWLPTLGEKEDAILKKLNPSSHQADYLYKHNQVFWKTKFKRVDTPPGYLWEDVSQYCIRCFLEETARLKIDYSPNPRDLLHCIQLLSVGALIDTVMKASNKRYLTGKGYQMEHQSLAYHADNFTWAKPHIRQYTENKCTFLLEVFKKLGPEGTLSKLYKEKLRVRAGTIYESTLIKEICRDYKIDAIRAKHALLSLENLGMIKIQTKKGRRSTVKLIRELEK